MKKKDIKVRLNMKLWEMVKEKMVVDFGKEFKDVDTILITSLLYLYKSNSKLRRADNLYLITKEPSDLSKENYQTKTICVYEYVMERLKESCSDCTNSQALERAFVDFLYLPLSFYTDNIKPIYTFVGSKNPTMQSATANAADAMNLNYEATILIDACCGTGALFLGLKTYRWKSVILNDMNPIRTNFLNVIKNKALEFVKLLMTKDVWTIDTYTADRLEVQREYKKNLDEYYGKRKNYHKVDCNLEIAHATLMYQSWNGQFVDDETKIFSRILKILPACLKLRNAIITQQDCLKYLENIDCNKLVILDPPYIGTEKECGIKGYVYDKFHDKVARKLLDATYPFLYFCRSSAPKSDKSRPLNEKERIMEMKLGKYFFYKGFYFQKVKLHENTAKEETELLISNQQYDANQFEWTKFEQDIR